ncbi:hypothetical protein [Eleftheria terrae]|uniref:hypothetical protein n=1 Tax=Eleftheria terrae TaxID=1597781 RepID=UPI00263A7713|nr:hypothetical protein [Eleftheria terrae]WKB56176.1 hypothetical protein N7L95_29480 [Eleftheria terrae]
MPLTLAAALLLGGWTRPAGSTSFTWQRIPGLHGAADVAALVSQSRGRCRLPTATDLLDWSRGAAQKSRSLDTGLYWVRPDVDREVGYGLYLHWPTGQVVEYGNLVFDAHLVLVCDKAAAVSAEAEGEPR